MVPLPPSAILILRSIHPAARTRPTRATTACQSGQSTWPVAPDEELEMQAKANVRSAAEGASLHRSPCPSRPPSSRYLITVYYSQFSPLGK